MTGVGGSGRRPIAGTAGYAEEAATLIPQYESLPFAKLHKHVLDLVPELPCWVLDIGAGTGRDAAGFAALGHRVVAVEPTAELRDAAVAMHSSDRIEWLDDSLPDLALLHPRTGVFDVVMLTAVWMHLDLAERRRAMPVVAGLLAPGGVIIMSLRHGPVPPGRRMFEVSAGETIELAESAGLRIVRRLDGQDGFFGRLDVSWTRLAFCRNSETGE
jgi:SAM-dependent methyltransferase